MSDVNEIRHKLLQFSGDLTDLIAEVDLVDGEAASVLELARNRIRECNAMLAAIAKDSE